MKVRIFLSAVLAGLTSCASLFSPSIPPIGHPPKADCASARAASLQKKSRELSTLKGSAYIRINFKDGRETSGKGIIIVKRPDKIRLEILGPWNQIIAVMVYAGRKVSFLSFRENRLYRDYPFPMKVSLLPHYLLGLPAGELESHEPANNEASGLPQGQCYINSKNERIEIDNEGNMKKIDILEARDDSPSIETFMDSYKDVDGFIFPFEISISNKEASIFIRYTDVELNRRILDELFSLPEQQEMGDRKSP